MESTDHVVKKTRLKWKKVGRESEEQKSTINIQKKERRRTPIHEIILNSVRVNDVQENTLADQIDRINEFLLPKALKFSPLKSEQFRHSGEAFI